VSVPRAVIVTMSPMMADIFREILSGEVKIEIVAEVRHRRLLEPRLRAIQPDLVLIGLRLHESDSIALALLMTLPNAKIIAFSSDARLAYLHQMRPHRTKLLNVSKDTLLALLRA
jgi:chemotaxis response regulator CheB